MKKISLLALLLIVVVLTLTACGNTPTTRAEIRWKDEEHTFVIRKKLSDDTIIKQYFTYYNREPEATTYEPDVEKLDEIMPDDVSGTYTMKISVNGNTCTLKTNQTLYASYPSATLKSFDVWNTPDKSGKTLSSFEVEAGSAEDPFNMTGWTTLKSTTETEVVFQNDATQRPLSSKNKVEGFYIGKTAQTISCYELETKYTWDDNDVTITVNGESQSTDGRYSEKFIDANQILLYVRSLDKTAESFQDTPSVSVYMPKEDKVVTASCLFTYDCDATVWADGKELCVRLSAVFVVVDGVALLTQLNIPDKVSDGTNLDYIPKSDSDLYKYSTVRFRSGIYSYHLADFSSLDGDTPGNGAKILNSIQPPIEEE